MRQNLVCSGYIPDAPLWAMRMGRLEESRGSQVQDGEAGLYVGGFNSKGYLEEQWTFSYT